MKQNTFPKSVFILLIVGAILLLSFSSSFAETDDPQPVAVWPMEPLIADTDWENWYQTESGYSPRTSDFGMYIALPVTETLYLGYRSGWNVDGALIARYDGANLEALGPLTEEGVDDMGWFSNTLHIPGVDPMDSWDTGNHYTWTAPGPIIKHRDAADGLVDVTHTFGMWIDEQDGTIYAATSTYDGPASPISLEPRYWHASLYVSQDGGVTWSLQGELPTTRMYDVFGLNGVLYGIGGYSLYKSDDQGVSWSYVPGTSGYDYRHLVSYHNHYVVGATPFNLAIIDENGATPYPFPAGYKAERTPNLLTTSDSHIYVTLKHSLDETFSVWRTADFQTWEPVIENYTNIASITYWPAHNWLIVADRGNGGGLWKVDLNAFTGCADVTEIPVSECEALVALYNSTDGNNWTNNTNWLQTNTPCSWQGIICTAGSITDLTLSSNQLSGTIPPELGNLSFLSDLRLTDNQLSGCVPMELTNLFLDRFYFDQTQLQELADAAFQSWLDAIPDLTRTNAPCAVEQDDTVLFVAPAATAVPVGSSFTLDLDVANATDLWGVDVELTFDPTKLQVVDADGATAGVQITSTSCPQADSLQANSADNSAGTISYVAVSLHPALPCTDGTVLSIAFTAVSETDATPLTIGTSALSTPNGESITHLRQAGTITIVPANGTLSGTATRQGASDHSGIVVTAWDGATEVGSTTTDASGSYALQLPASTVTITVEGPLTLDAEKAGVVVVTGHTTTLTAVELPAGDLDDSDAIDVIDLSTLAPQYGKASTAPGWDARADLNQDNKADILDLSILAGNYGKRSPVDWP